MVRRPAAVRSLVAARLGSARPIAEMAQVASGVRPVVQAKAVATIVASIDFGPGQLAGTKVRKEQRAIVS